MKFILFNIDLFEGSDLTALSDQECLDMAAQDGFVYNSVEDFQSAFNSEIFTNSVYQLRVVNEETQTEKEILINSIKEIIGEYGNFSMSELDGVDSPMINGGKDNHTLAESFDIDGVEGVTYVHESVTNEQYYRYEDLEVSVIESILEVVKVWGETEEQFKESGKGL